MLLLLQMRQPRRLDREIIAVSAPMGENCREVDSFTNEIIVVLFIRLLKEEKKMITSSSHE